MAVYGGEKLQIFFVPNELKSPKNNMSFYYFFYYGNPSLSLFIFLKFTFSFLCIKICLKYKTDRKIDRKKDRQTEGKTKRQTEGQTFKKS